MDLSMKWLHDFVDCEHTGRDYAEALTMSGSKVEKWTNEADGISNIVVGKVLKIDRHPDADKLVVCSIDVGREEKLQIVTGATNLTEGDIVPVCLDGAILPDGKKIKKGKLRGVLSEGMLCSLGELGLTAHDFPNAIEDGIFVLDSECDQTLGTDICTAIGLNDTTVEFEITSNRPDCLSVIGLARETAVTYDLPLHIPTPTYTDCGSDVHDYLAVENQAPELCSRYMARVVKDVHIAPSPRWMRERLRASGVRPINNIVDITNYVMLEYGQPMHAFDHKYIKDGKIIVRRAASGETITTLDGEERRLTDKMLVIADSEKPSAVAGVMGGEYSGINDDTAVMVFESACFNGASVRTTARDIGLRTDSSARFEKGLDPENCAGALDRACQLVEQLGAGKVVGGTIDLRGDMHTPAPIPFRPDWINSFLGTDIAQARMIQILTDLECTVENGKVTPPSFRADLEQEADIAEEIARIYGYNNIPTTKIRGSAQGKLTDEQKFERTVSDTLLALGFNQILTYSFISPKYYDKICMPQDSPLRRSVTITNPLGEDTSIMRTTALPSMLEILSANYANRNLSVKLSELATEYLPNGDDELPEEKKKIILGAYGENTDFYALKGAVEALLARCEVQSYDIRPAADRPEYHPGRCAVLSIGDEELAVFGQLHPAVQENYGMDTPVFAASIDLAVMFKNRADEQPYRPLPKYPAVTRDLAVLCDISLPVIELQKAIEAGAGKLLEAVELFDVYQGAQIPAGKKSVAYSFTLRSKDSTLTDADITRVTQKVIAKLEALGATLRS